MRGRIYTSSDQDYKFGFNGEYKDDEVKGVGVHYDYGFRIYDTRIAKFLSVDPLTRSYPMLTTYQFACNTPIQAFDLDGLEANAADYYHENNGSVKMELVFDSDLLDINIVYERHFMRSDPCKDKSEYGMHRRSVGEYSTPAYVSCSPNFAKGKFEYDPNFLMHQCMQN